MQGLNFTYSSGLKKINVMRNLAIWWACLNYLSFIQKYVNIFKFLFLVIKTSILLNQRKVEYSSFLILSSIKDKMPYIGGSIIIYVTWFYSHNEHVLANSWITTLISCHFKTLIYILTQYQV